MANNTLTPEDRSKGGKNHANMLRMTRAAYMKTLLDWGTGKRKVTGPQLAALSKYADLRGWHPPKSRKNVLSERNLRKLAHKPAITDDLEARLSALIPKPRPAIPPLPNVSIQPTQANVINKPNAPLIA